MQTHIHIIAFDIPFPANYGGAIDVFYKIKCLQQQGVKITLHCFDYGNKARAKELESLCEKVYYYKRNMSFFNHLSLLPFNVKSRISKELKENLLKDNYPILFEILHSCYLLNDVDLKNRIKLFRHSNIEHDYFNELAKAETSFLKKMYLYIEAFKLKCFEKIITNATFILSVSEKDLEYFKHTYPKTNSLYLPSFHQYNELTCKVGKGTYILYHGNLHVSENYLAAHWLIDNVFSKINYPIIIAGLNPPQQLIDKIKHYAHIQLKANCNESDMQGLIDNAHIHCLYTQQATGLKLKLLNVLYSGRFVVANSAMLAGTQLNDAVNLCETPQQYLNTIDSLMLKEFTEVDKIQREKTISIMNNKEKTNTLLSLLK